MNLLENKLKTHKKRRYLLNKNSFYDTIIKHRYTIDSNGYMLNNVTEVNQNDFLT